MRPLLVLALIVLTACAGTPRKPALTEADYPGVLVDSQELPDGLFVRQRIEARFRDRKDSFSAVLQVEGGVLSLLALTPYGTRAFLIEQRGQRISYTAYVDRELPFPPRFIVLDVHRAMFAGLGDGAAADGVRVIERNGERLTETWRGGKLYERRFERLDGKPEGAIRISYPDGLAPVAIPERVTLDSGWFGYQLKVERIAD